MTKQSLKLLLLTLATVVFLSILAQNAAAQTRPRQVNDPHQVKLVRRPRRFHQPPTPSPGRITEGATAKRIDLFLRRLDQLAKDYLQPIDSSR